MKQYILTVSMVLLSAINMWGAKGNSTPMSFTQPDGTTIEVVLRGDEHMHWFMTLDGAILARQDNAFYLAKVEDGELKPTNILVHNKDARSFAEVAAIEHQDKAAMFSFIDAEREKNVRKVSIDNRTPAYFGHMGSPKALVVLAEYSDLPFSIEDPQKSFDQLFNAEGEGTHENYGHDENRNYMSVREYFKTCSRGLYTPEFVVTKPVKVGTMGTYGGKNENSSNDENVPQLIKDCMEGIADQYNLLDFDNDNDGRVDLVYVIFSGYCQNNGGPANSVWSKTGSTNTEINGTKLTWYSCTSEFNLYEAYYTKRSIEPWINGIGLPCHEIGHALGLPDIYPTSSSAWVDNQEMEYWDLMDGGEYVKNGYSPKDYTAWEREVMGWDTIEEITENNTTISLTPLLEGGKAYKFCNPANKEEYFVMENIQNNGLNKSFPGHGMIVYHVKYPYSSVYMAGDPNNTKGKPGMAIVPADGIVMSSYLDYSTSDYRESHKGDPFPGTSIVTSLTYDMNLPNYVWYDGETVVKSCLLNITEDYDTGVVTFTYQNGTPVTAITLDATEAEIYVDEQVKLNATITPADADDTTVTWTTSDEDIATVDENGLVTAIAGGEAVITAKTNDGSNLSATCKVSVLRLPQTILWDQEIADVELGSDMILLTATTNSELPVVYTSSNENVGVIVDSYFFNPVAVGTTVITASQAGTERYLPASEQKTINVVEPSGIQNITTSSLAVYNILGLKIGNYTQKEFDSRVASHLIPAGVYFINGKKYIVK